MNEVGDLGASAAAEWATLVNTAVLGTDRRPLPPAAPGWASLVSAPDAAVELLNRAAAVTAARRSGVQPNAVPLLIVAADPDPRQACSPAATNVLQRLLRGEHEVLLPEWFSLCHHARLRIPAYLLPALLLRGRRNPAFDHAVRAVAGPRAQWLAEAMPELGLRSTPKPLPADAMPFLPPTPPADSGAVVAAIAGAFADHAATWAAAPQLRLAVASIEPRWLPALVLELNRAGFNPVTERSRVDLLGLAQVRHELIMALQPGAQLAHRNDPAGADSQGDAAGTRVRLPS